MAGYDQKIKIRAKFEKEARSFFSFLQRVGKKYSRPVRIRYRYLGQGYFYVNVDGGSGGIDALFQELILNRGLYYYSCTLSNKKETISFAILPIFRQLIDYAFENPKSRFLRKHILGKYSQKDFVPSRIKNSYGYDFEILFRRWDLKIISNKNYVIGLDAIFTNFLLDKIKHRTGEKSGRFQSLINSIKKMFVFDSITEENFKKIHKIRTGMLHRLESSSSTDELYDISNNLFRYFEYLDEFEESQLLKCVHGRKRKARRFKYGESIWEKEGEKEYGSAVVNQPCHDCGVTRGFFHVTGCDFEQCPICRQQLLGCSHHFRY